ncbi:MAG: response regulator [Elainella sp. Prado103]|jgi:CheY-like chemotaxis protein|nr:response regulator [Elainella sp. Prado103]
MASSEYLIQKTSAALQLTPKRILVVNPTATLREVIASCLQNLWNWQVLTSASGQDALLQARTTSLDGIILDDRMPEMDDLTLLRYLHSDPITQHIPIILLTTHHNLPCPEILTSLGVILTIAQPFHPIDLVQRIVQAIEI